MNKQQLKDSKKCVEMQSNGKDMECFDCSCSVCLMQQPSNTAELKQLLSVAESILANVPMLPLEPLELEDLQILEHNSKLMIRILKKLLGE